MHLCIDVKMNEFILSNIQKKVSQIKTKKTNIDLEDDRLSTIVARKSQELKKKNKI